MRLSIINIVFWNRRSTPNSTLPYFPKISIKIFFLISGISTSNSINNYSSVIINCITSSRFNFIKIYEILLISFYFDFKIQIIKLISTSSNIYFPSRIPILFINIFEVSKNRVSTFFIFSTANLLLLLPFNVSKNFFFLF